MYRYRTRGTCANGIDIELDGDVVKSIQFYGGCNGNLKAIAAISVGKSMDELAAVWEGNTCGYKSTSCADQLIKAFRKIQQYEAEGGQPALEGESPVMLQG